MSDHATNGPARPEHATPAPTSTSTTTHQTASSATNSTPSLPDPHWVTRSAPFILSPAYAEILGRRRAHEALEHERRAAPYTADRTLANDRRIPTGPRSAIPNRPRAAIPPARATAPPPSRTPVSTRAALYPTSRSLDNRRTAVQRAPQPPTAGRNAPQTGDPTDSPAQATQHQQPSAETNADPPGATIHHSRRARMPPQYDGADDADEEETYFVGRRTQETIVPRWQPDSEVSACFNCNAPFSFWNRKHHCRKCGRVVCAGCSSHRISIPNAYIVQPDEEDDNDEEDPASRELMRSGSSTVRLCNPCVPDPWMPQAPRQADNAPPPPVRAANNNLPRPATTREQPDVPEGLQRVPSERLQRVPSDEVHELRSRYHRTGGKYQHWEHDATDVPGLDGPFSHNQPLLGRPPPSRVEHSRALAFQGRPASYMLPSNNTSMNQFNPAADHHHNYPLSARSFDSHPSSSSSRPVPHRHSLGPTMDPRRMSGNFTQRPQNWYIPNELRSTEATNMPPPPLKMKRKVKEEDECPVCGIELAPDEQLREKHVQDCIAARFSTGATPPANIGTANSTATAAAPTNTYPAVRTGADPATPPTIGNRPRTTSYRPRGMAVYTATEKDCTNADGEAQECIICFEEFQPGDELGRMECLCKFHRHCIKSWWATKGGGSCPTHQLTE